MKNHYQNLLVFYLFLFVLNSCGSVDGSGSLTGTVLSIIDIQGNWTATSAIFDSTVEGPSQMIDVLDQGGSATMVIQSNGRFTIPFNDSGGGQGITSGQQSFDEDPLLIAFDDSPGEEGYFGIQRTNNDNNRSHSGPAEYDFDGDGTDEQAQATLIFVRSRYAAIQLYTPLKTFGTIHSGSDFGISGNSI